MELYYFENTFVLRMTVNNHFYGVFFFFFFFSLLLLFLANDN